MKVLIKSAWGSDDPTKAAFAFLHANAFAEAGHEVQIFLLGEAVNLMKAEVMSSVTPVEKRTVWRRCAAQYVGSVASVGVIHRPVTLETNGTLGSCRRMERTSAVKGSTAGSIIPEWKA